MVAEIVIGAMPNETVTVAIVAVRPTYPAAGFTPPSTAATARTADHATLG